mmetsp:Transcript_10087/g.46228  ORF Transcript_10087/g.46228 Transcript_10087/m.46228 type:complete len:250 (-) Transcript_10087:663-1412(-)
MHRLNSLGSPLGRPRRRRRALGLTSRRRALGALDQPENPAQVPNLRILPLLVRDEAPVELRQPSNARHDLVPRRRALRHRVTGQPHLREGREIVQCVDAVPFVNRVVREQQRLELLERYRSPRVRLRIAHASQPVPAQMQPLQRREQRQTLNLGPVLQGVALQVERDEPRERRRRRARHRPFALAQRGYAAVREAQLSQRRARGDDRGRLLPRRAGPVHDEHGEVRKRRRRGRRTRGPRGSHPGELEVD